MNPTMKDARGSQPPLTQPTNARARTGQAPISSQGQAGEFILSKPTTAPLAGWKARLLEEIEKVVKNPHRPTIVVLRYNGAGCWQVIPAGPPSARIDTSEG